jgi:hypothetical protein
MSSDWMREHKETNETWGCASMVGFLCCLQGERKRCRFVNVTGRFLIFFDWIGWHKERNVTNGGAPMAWCLCCLKAERKGCLFLHVNVSAR